MFENPDNPFLKFNFLMTLMFHVGPYGEYKKIVLMLNIQRDKNLLHGRNITFRFSWVKKYVSFGEKMKWCCIYRREKKWNLEGPDGFHCYWHDLRKEKKIFKQRQSGGGSAMTWGAFCSNGIFKLVLVSGNMDSKQYTDMRTKHFLEDFFRIAGNRAIFQQDNAPIHKCVKAFKSVF